MHINTILIEKSLHARKSETALLNIGASLFCSQDFSRELYFSGSSAILQGSGTARKRPVSGGKTPSSRN
jgi:hypothetical protein